LRRIRVPLDCIEKWFRRKRSVAMGLLFIETMILWGVNDQIGSQPTVSLAASVGPGQEEA
jgi:hypothetical protein